MKKIWFLLLSLVLFLPETAEAITYEPMWTGIRVVLTRAEALELANDMEDITKATQATALFSAFLPDPIVTKVVAVFTGVGAWRVGTVVAGLRRHVTKKGAYLEIGWLNPFGGILFNTVARGR